MGDLVEKRLPFVFISISLLVTYLFVATNYFTYLGLAISFSILASLVYMLKPKRTTYDYVCYFLILFFSLFLVLRSNPLLTFLNIVSILYAGSFLSLPTKKQKEMSIIGYIFTPLFIVFESLKTKNKYLFSSMYKRMAMQNSSFKPILLTIVLVLVVVPLLASANPLFEQIVTKVTQFFQIDSLYDFIFSGNIPLRVLFFSTLLFFLPRLISLMQDKKEIGIESFYSLNFSFFIPKLVLSIILAVFFITQAQLYFSTIETLRALNYTYSEYAREVFAQLTVVSGILIALLYNDHKEEKLSKRLTYILLVEGIFLAFMALKSVYDYSNQWGFTEKRLWGFTGVFWMLAVYRAYLYSYRNNLVKKLFPQSIIGISFITLLLVNFLNFDSLIYSYKKSSTESGYDYPYLSRLSPDAKAYQELLPKEMELLSQNSQNDLWFMHSNAAWTLIDRIEYLQWKHKDLDFRTFNYGEYQQYLLIKDMNTEEARKKLDEVYTMRTP